MGPRRDPPLAGNRPRWRALVVDGLLQTHPGKPKPVIGVPHDRCGRWEGRLGTRDGGHSVLVHVTDRLLLHFHHASVPVPHKQEFLHGHLLVVGSSVRPKSVLGRSRTSVR